MDTLLRDLRYGLRCLAKRRGITAIAIVTLALGIGANSAIFSVVNAIVLRPLPYPESEKLVVIWGNIHAPGLEELELSAPFSRDNPKWYEIVGVVGNIKHRGLDIDYKPELYISFLQPLFTPPGIPSLYVVIRSTGDPDSVVAVARNEVAAIDRDQPIGSVMTMDQRIHESVAPRRFNMFLLTLFAVLAVLLASVGIYGIMAFSVTQRTREFGVRLALGAQRSDVMSMVLRHGIKLALCGVAVGLVAAFALTRLMSSLLFEVSPTDVSIFLLDAVVLLFVSLLACYFPARRATNVDPLVALRHE